jgi:hypothetical protein
MPGYYNPDALRCEAAAQIQHADSPVELPCKHSRKAKEGHQDYQGCRNILSAANLKAATDPPNDQLSLPREGERGFTPLEFGQEEELGEEIEKDHFASAIQRGNGISEATGQPPGEPS